MACPFFNETRNHTLENSKKTVFWDWAIAMEQKGEPRIIFPPCLPWKRPLRCPFLPAKRRKEYIMDLVCVCDGPSLLPVEEIAFSCTRRECSQWTSPLPVKEKAVLWTWCALAGGFPRRPKKPPEVPGELSKPKHAILVNKCNTKVIVFGTRSKLYIFCSWFCSWPLTKPAG